MLFSLGYLGLRRVLELMVWARRSDLDKELEILVLRHQIRSASRPLNLEAARARPCCWLRVLHRSP